MASVSVTNSTGATDHDSARIDILDGSARVVAKNTGSRNILVVKVMYKSFLAYSYKEWKVYPGKTLDTTFSIPVNTYWLRIGPVDARLKATGTGTLYN